MPEPITDIRDEQQVAKYLLELDQEHPGIIQTLREMNTSYQQYIIALSMIKSPYFFSSDSVTLTL